MRPSSIFLIVALLATAVGVCILFAPYLPVFIVAIVFGTIFEPLNSRLRTYLGRGFAAFFSTLIVLLIIIGPVALTGTALIREAASLGSSIASDTALHTAQAHLETKIQEYIPFVNIDLTTYSEAALKWLASHIDNAFKGLLATGTVLFLGAIALFYWFKDADSLAPIAMRLSPLGDEDDKRIIDRLSTSIRTVMRGTMTIAIIQGTLAAVGYFIFGIPNAILWGAVTTISALIPGIGTSLVLIPIVVYLFVSGATAQAIGLAIWAATAVGLIDNILGPRLIGRGTDIHPFFILISVLGGIQLFGPIGFLAGPLLISLFFALLDVYSLHLKNCAA